MVPTRQENKVLFTVLLIMKTHAYITQYQPQDVMKFQSILDLSPRFAGAFLFDSFQVPHALTINIVGRIRHAEIVEAKR